LEIAPGLTSTLTDTHTYVLRRKVLRAVAVLAFLLALTVFSGIHAMTFAGIFYRWLLRTDLCMILVRSGLQPLRIDCVHRIVEYVPVEIRVATVELDRVLGGPPSGLRVVVSRTESHETRIAIIKSTSEPEWLKPGCGVANHAPELIVVDL